MMIGSSKHNNEQSYLLRKFVSMWGSNNCDHQARICHSTTVAGVAQTFGYGAMTNSFNDLHYSKAVMFIGSNPAEAHPISMLHFLHAKELGAKMIVVDPRFTRTARFAHHYVRVRPGTDIPLVWGILWHIFENGWEDKEYIAARTYGMDDVRKEVAKWTPDKVTDVTGVPEASVRMAAEMLAKNKPSSVVWCMGITQHHVGTANVRALCILQLALGNIGVPAAAPTSTAATTTCRAPPTSARTAIRCPATTASPKAPGSTSATSGASTTTGSSRASAPRS
jgi:formate dehydrogenase major subunit